MSQFKSRLEKLEGKMRMNNNYSQIIERHAIGDKGMLVHTIMALYINSYREHKSAIKARNYLEWIHNQSFNAIQRAYSAIKDLVAAGLATFAPTEFISDSRDTSSMIPPYPYLCNAEQILHYSTSSDNQFWTTL